MRRSDGHSINQTVIPESPLGSLNRIELCSAIATFAVIAVTAFIVWLR
jgi:hypothetical protein